MPPEIAGETTTAVMTFLAGCDAVIFQTRPGDPSRKQPTEITFDLSQWQGQTIRLRLASADNEGPLRAGVDAVRLEPIAK